MYFIDDIYFVFSLCRFKSCFFDKLTNIFDSVIGSSIDFDNIEHISSVKRLAVCTFMTRISILQIFAINSFCEYTSTCCLSCPTRASEYIGLTYLIQSECTTKNSRDSILTNNRSPVLGTIFGRERHENTR